MTHTHKDENKDDRDTDFDLESKERCEKQIPKIPIKFSKGFSRNSRLKWAKLS